MTYHLIKTFPKLITRIPAAQRSTVLKRVAAQAALRLDFKTCWVCLRGLWNSL